MSLQFLAKQTTALAPLTPLTLIKGCRGLCLLTSSSSSEKSIYNYNIIIINNNTPPFINNQTTIQPKSQRMFSTSHNERTPRKIGHSNRQRAGDWTCKSCDANNFGRNTVCFKCGEAAEEGVGGIEVQTSALFEKREERNVVKPGDWACPECQVNK